MGRALEFPNGLSVLDLVQVAEDVIVTHVLTQEADGPVGEEEVGASFVPTAETPRILQLAAVVIPVVVDVEASVGVGRSSVAAGVGTAPPVGAEREDTGRWQGYAFASTRRRRLCCWFRP